MQNEAVLLNQSIKKANKTVFELHSLRGLSIFNPHLGILNQSAQAKNTKINATIGIAKDDLKKPLNLPSISQIINLPVQEVFPYAPGTGVLKLREKWQENLFKKNPALNLKKISLPIVTAGVTHGLSIIGYLFINNNDEIILPDLFWENYELVFGNTWGGKITTYKTFSSNGFNISGLKNALFKKGKKKIVILNFPNNPTGYTPLKKEVKQIIALLLKAASSGKQILVLVDDAYFGLVYEKGVEEKSIFTYLHNLHSNILCVKLDGATKEDYVWGFRIGFITYGIKNATESLYKALMEKTAGAIRATISNASLLPQSLLLKAYQSPTYQKEKQKNFQLLKKRYLKVKEILTLNNKYREEFSVYPFNSGYFLCLKLKKTNIAEKVRQRLLNKYDTGVIVFENNIRVAFSSVELNNLEALFKNIYSACKEVHKNA